MSLAAEEMLALGSGSQLGTASYLYLGACCTWAVWPS